MHLVRPPSRELYLSPGVSPPPVLWPEIEGDNEDWVPPNAAAFVQSQVFDGNCSVISTISDRARGL